MSNARNLARLLPNASGQLPDAAMASGSVLQVVQSVTGNQVATSTTTLVDTGLSATITPLSSTSRILCIFEHPVRCTNGNVSGMKISLLRGGSVIYTPSQNLGYSNPNTSGDRSFMICGNFVDSPGTASPVTYKTQFSAPNLAFVQIDGDTASMTLLEIAA